MDNQKKYTKPAQATPKVISSASKVVDKPKQGPSKVDSKTVSKGKQEVGNAQSSDQKRFTAHKFDPHKQANILSTTKKHLTYHESSE
jgi:hypothetical protein